MSKLQAQKKAAEIIPALFLDMFGDPATNPKGWPTASFGDLVVNRDGARRPVKSADRASRQGQYPYYGASGVIDFVDQYIYDGTHLLIAEDGANLVSRSTPIAFKATGRYWVNNHAHVVAQKAGTDLSYLEVALNLRDLRDFITGSAQPKLTQANLNAILVAVPPAKEQARFAELTTHLLSIQEQQANALSKAEKTFSALLARAFSESRLTGSQLPAEEIAA
ncbi:restriction endonuclease subunit S [Accumulibacter sp.]|uniref:restriction endonuclease subunit S n=1 Tax=Accumulibacter sp. TaxID=2053492 RepID=UPI0025899EFA|nr:restriction endonuclease subunit S [Accumulibacter sp.]